MYNMSTCLHEFKSLNYEGGCASLRNPFTKRRKSENTSLRGSSVPVVLDLVGGPLRGGVPSAANKLSAAPIGVLLLAPPSTRGSETRLPTGLVNVAPVCVVVVAAAPGSISRDDRNDVLSRSVLVLVMVRNESRRLFCSDRGVPFKSRI